MQNSSGGLTEIAKVLNESEFENFLNLPIVVKGVKIDGASGNINHLFVDETWIAK